LKKVETELARLEGVYSLHLKGSDLPLIVSVVPF
jgi:hypothetical protein